MMVGLSWGCQDIITNENLDKKEKGPVTATSDVKMDGIKEQKIRWSLTRHPRKSI